jgi:hypothetical protein
LGNKFYDFPAERKLQNSFFCLLSPDYILDLVLSIGNVKINGIKMAHIFMEERNRKREIKMHWGIMKKIL